MMRRRILPLHAIFAHKSQFIQYILSNLSALLHFVISCKRSVKHCPPPAGIIKVSSKRGELMRRHGFSIAVAVTALIFLSSFVMLFFSPVFAIGQSADATAHTEVLWQGNAGLPAADKTQNTPSYPLSPLPGKAQERAEEIPFSSLLLPGTPMDAKQYSDLLDFVADFNTYFYAFTDKASLDDMVLSANLADYYLFSYRYHAASDQPPFYIAAAQRANEYVRHDEQAVSLAVSKDYVNTMGQSLFGRTLQVVNDRDLAGYHNEDLVFPSVLDKHMGYLADVKSVLKEGDTILIQYDLYANSYLNADGISEFIPSSAQFLLDFDQLSEKVRYLASGELCFRLLPEGGVQVISNQRSEEDNPQAFVRSAL